jgi:uncharacterized membrane protein YeaQ/YmgE (transglycosylase-associated protein family)
LTDSLPPVIAFLVAGVILGALARVLNSKPGAPPLVLTVVVGVVGALIGGVGINLLLSNDAGDLNGWSFTLACVLGFALLGLLEGRVGRRAD